MFISDHSRTALIFTLIPTNIIPIIFAGLHFLVHQLPLLLNVPFLLSLLIPFISSMKTIISILRDY